MANLATFEAQDIIRDGRFDPTNYDAVYDIYACAHGEEAAKKARADAVARLVKESCNNAYQK